MISIIAARHEHEATISGFQSRMAKETESIFLNATVLSRGVRNVLDNPERGEYRLALAGKEVVGCLMITYEWSDWRNGYFVWIQSVYVVPQWRRKGVFRQLYSDVLKEVDSRPDWLGIRLYVEKDNATARKVYAELGMRDDRYVMYERLYSDDNNMNKQI